MNAERLHSVVDYLVTQYNERSILQQWNQLVDSLQAVTQSPGSVEHAKAFSDRYKVFKDQLLGFTAAPLPPSYRDILREINAENYLGPALLKRFEDTLAANAVATAAAIPQLQTQHREITAYIKQLSGLVSAFSTLSVARDELQAGAAEIGLLLPKDLFDPRLLDLSKELKQWDFVVRGINEVASDNKEDVRLRAISSSDWQFFLVCGFAFLTCFNWVLQKLVAILKNMVEIKSNWQALVDKGVPKEGTEPLKKYIDGYIEAETRKAAVEAVAKFHKEADAGRKNELTNHMNQALMFLASRLDSGVQIDLRLSMTLAPLPEEAAANAPAAPDAAALQTLQSDITSTTALLEELHQQPVGNLKLAAPDLAAEAAKPVDAKKP
jgi:hypothetical protein